MQGHVEACDFLKNNLVLLDLSHLLPGTLNDSAKRRIPVEDSNQDYLIIFPLQAIFVFSGIKIRDPEEVELLTCKSVHMSVSDTQ